MGAKWNQLLWTIQEPRHKLHTSVCEVVFNCLALLREVSNNLISEEEIGLRRRVFLRLNNNFSKHPARKKADS